MRNHVSPDSHMAPGQTWTTYPQVACKVEMIFADFILPFPSPNDYMGCDKFHGLGGSDSNFNIVMKGDYECCILSSDDEIQECGPRVDPPSGCCSDQPYCKGSPAFPSCCSGPPCKEWERRKKERKREKKERERRKREREVGCVKMMMMRIVFVIGLKKNKLNVPFHKSTSFQIVNTNTLVEISDVYTCVRVWCVDVGRSIRLTDGCEAGGGGRIGGMRSFLFIDMLPST